MIPAAFGYQRPASIEEALRDPRLGPRRQGAGRRPESPAAAQAASRIGRHARRHRSAARATGVRRLDDGRIAIGALTTYAELLESPVKDYGADRRRAAEYRRLQVRNRGTIGGAIAHADPASDMPACLLALDAELVIRSASGERTTGVDGFFEGAFTTGLEPGEIDHRDPAAGSARRRRVGLRHARAAGLGLRDGRRGRGRVRRRRRAHLDARTSR